MWCRIGHGKYHALREISIDMETVLDRGHNRHLVFVTKDKPMLFPYLNRLVPQSWNNLNGIAQKHKLRGSWTSLTTLITKGSIQNLMWLSTTRLWQQKVLFRTWCGWVWQDSDSKRFYSEPDVVKHDKDSKPKHDLILGTKPWKS